MTASLSTGKAFSKNMGIIIKNKYTRLKARLALGSFVFGNAQKE